MRTRSARIGFFAIAGICAVDLGRELYLDAILARLRKSGDVGGLTTQLETLDYLWMALWIAAAIAAFMCTFPKSVGARRVTVGIGAMFLLEIAIHVGQMAWLKTMSSSGSMDAFKLVYEISWTSIQVVALAGAVFTGIALLRIGKAVNHTHASAIAIGATAPRVAAAVPSAFSALSLGEAFSPAIRTALTWFSHAASLALIGGFVWGAVQIAKLPSEEAPAEAPDSVKIGPEWGAVAGGIYTYLLAGLVRILIGIFSFMTVQGAAKAYDSYGEMHSLHDQIVMLGYVGGAAALVMIGSLTTFARIDSEKIRGPAVGAIVAMLLGLALDAITTSMTASAMTSVSAAFDAMDYLPVLAAVGSGVGVAGAWMLLRALAGASELVGLPENARRASLAGTIAIIAGLVGALAQLAIKGLPPGLAIVLAVLVVPAMIYVAIQLVRVMLALAGAIQEKAGR